MNTLLEEEESLKRRVVELNSLNNWKYFLTKLRISERLNKVHGKLNSEDEESNFTDELEDDDFSIHSDNSGSDTKEFGGGGFFISGNPESNSATEKYEATPEGFEEPYIGKLEGNEGVMEAKYMVEDTDFIEEESGGGFFVEDPEPEAKYSQARIGGPLINVELDDMPDYYFKQDENGELIYDPSSDGNQLRLESSGADGTDTPKGNHDLSCTYLSKEALPDRVLTQDDTHEETSQMILSPEAANDIEATGKTIVDKNDSSVSSCGKSLSGVESFQDSLGEEIAKEEQVFGFEYSDTD